MLRSDAVRGPAPSAGGLMASKNKGGRETKKPKADSNKKVKGQTPSATPAALDAIKSHGKPKG
ncbi:MAG: hypothetical protein QOK42_1308 [Frankiaceae bacterium]|nr:hypothetical protein [Frankiaceae bacterium]MDX6224740.1 hypothetical protein [Frankiales bacterium]